MLAKRYAGTNATNRWNITHIWTITTKILSVGRSLWKFFFLKERFKDLLEISQSENNVIQDRTIYEGVYVFTANNYAMGNLDERDYETYMELFEDMTDAVRYPDLMLYLQASVSHLVANIEKRGRNYEQRMPLDYLENINKRYERLHTKSV